MIGLGIPTTCLEAGMTCFRLFFIVIFLSILVFSAGSSLARQQEGQGRSGPPGGWSSFLQGGAVYQFDTDLDEGEL